MYLLYNLGLNLLFIITLPYTAAMLLLNRQNMRQRWGWYQAATLNQIGAQKPVWFHAASLGEVAVIAPIIAEIHKKSPAYPVIVSTVTATGCHRALQIIPESRFTFILPMDVPFMIKKVVKLLRPRALFIAETELWPNLLRYAKKYSARVILINGTMSDRSYQKYRLVKPLTRKVLSQFDFLSFKGLTDRQKFCSLGAPPERVEVLGNIKFDFSGILKHENTDRDVLLRQWHLPANSCLFIAGCTRPGEEDIILEAFMTVRKKTPGLICVIAPRHLNRLSEIERLLEQKHLPYCRKTKLGPDITEPVVIVLDTMGELQEVYSLAAVVFIGGSLFNFGGHNPLEPAIYKVPILFGPYMEMNKVSASLLLEKRGAVQVDNQSDLEKCLVDLLTHPEKRKEMGARAYQVIQENKGIVNRYLEVFIQRNLI